MPVQEGPFQNLVAVHWTTITLDTVSSPIVDDHANRLATGSGFGASQGTGYLVIANNADLDLATVTQNQTITAWSDTSITFTADFGSLSLGTNYAFVVNDDAAESNGVALTLASATITAGIIDAVDDEFGTTDSIFEGMTIYLSATSGAERFGAATGQLYLRRNSIDYAQPITSWANTQIKFTTTGISSTDSSVGEYKRNVEVWLRRDDGVETPRSPSGTADKTLKHWHDIRISSRTDNGDSTYEYEILFLNYYVDPDFNSEPLLETNFSVTGLTSGFTLDFNDVTDGYATFDTDGSGHLLIIVSGFPDGSGVLNERMSWSPGY